MVLICAKLIELRSSISPRGLIISSVSIDKNEIIGKIISPYNRVIKDKGEAKNTYEIPKKDDPNKKISTRYLILNKFFEKK